jgi:hypothetical protein
MSTACQGPGPLSRPRVLEGKVDALRRTHFVPFGNYVLLELTLLRSSASPQDRLSLPREPESGSLSPLFHCFPPDNFIPGFPCPHPTQGSPHCQMDDLVTSVLSPSRTPSQLPWDPSHASRSWWIALFLFPGNIYIHSQSFDSRSSSNNYLLLGLHSWSLAPFSLIIILSLTQPRRTPSHQVAASCCDVT